MGALHDLHFSFMAFTVVKLIVSTNSLAEGPPRKLTSSGHRLINFAHLNESITLKCPIEFSEYPTFVEWIKGNTSLYMMQGYEITHKGYLKIKSVTNQHAGTYTCEGINGYGSTRVNLTLIIDNPETENQNYTAAKPNSANRKHSYPPSIAKRPSSSVVDGVGGEATFHCVASGQPWPHIFWLKDGHLIRGAMTYISKRRTHSILKLRSLKKSDEGVYKCIARNKIGEDEIDFSLQVTEPSPPPKILALDPPSATIHEGATTVFVCDVTSKPGAQLHIKWLKKYHKKTGESLDLNGMNLFRLDTTYYRPLNLTYSVSINDGVYKSKLLIRNSCKDDAGTYVCLALNDAGFNFKNSTLTVIGTATQFSTQAHFAASSASLAIIVTIVFVVILAVTVIISHLLCRSKPGDKAGIYGASVAKNFDSRSFRQSVTSVRNSNKGNLNPFPEASDPQSISKLLGSDSTFLYEHGESQISKLTQAKPPIH